MSSIWKTPSVSAQEVAPAATSQTTDRDTGTSPLDQQKKNKKKYGFASTTGSVTSEQTLGV